MTSTDTITQSTSWIKLRNGSWGCKGYGLKVGATATVTRRDGSTSEVRIDKVVWTGDNGLSIAACTTIGERRPATRTATSATRTTAVRSNRTAYPPARRCEDCGSTRGVHWATDMSGIGGYACRSCDDGTLSFC